MPFTICPYRCVTVQCSVKYQTGLLTGTSTFPEPYLLTDTEEMIIDDLLAVLNQHGLTSQQS